MMVLCSGCNKKTKVVYTSDENKPVNVTK